MEDEKHHDTSPENKVGPEDLLQFAALLAHQLKSPVGAAGSLLKTIIGEYAGHLNARQKDLLSRADRRIEEAIDAASRMLTIVRPEQDDDEEEPVAEATGLVNRTRTRFAEDAAQRDIDLTVDIELEPALVHIREAALFEALNALVNNAIKYTPDNGKISITVRKAPEEGQLRIIVADSGIGIPEGQREKIFEPFYRSPNAQNTTLPGVGLGLAFVKALVNRAGGDIWIETSIYGGAAFIMQLFSAEELPRPETGFGSEPERLKVVIVGGVAAGPKVASKIIRMHPETQVTIIEREEFLSYAGCGLPYYVSGVVDEQKELMSTALGCVRDSVFFQHVKHVNVLSRTEATEIDRVEKRVRIKDLRSEEERWIAYDKLVLATGAVPIMPNLGGRELKNIFTLHGMRDAEGVRLHLLEQKAKDVVIVGGGLIGVEMTEALVTRGCRVTIVERDSQILGMLDWEMAHHVERHMESRGVRIMTNAKAHSFSGEEFVRAVVTDKGTVPADMVILGVGVRPRVELARIAGLEIGSTGAVKVDARMLTSDSDIYAAGDCVECIDMLTDKPCYVPLGSTANKQGRIAAVNICGGNETFPGVLGTTVCKVFDFCVARTGLTAGQAAAAGYDPVIALCGGPDREHFMPEARTLLLKLIADPVSRRLLGVQAVGPGEGAKRIDVAATAIAAGMTVDQIANLDLGYAPPYSQAMDSLITGANVLRNKIAGLLTGICPVDVHAKMERNEDFLLLDVGTPQEYEVQRLPGSKLISLGMLRSRLSELPRDKDIIIISRLCIRAYEAALILQSAGFSRVQVVDGGLVAWPFEKIFGMK